MTKEGRGDPGWSAGVRQKAEELAALVSEERFGVEGAPLEFSFSEIEEIGHQVGRLTAGAVDRALQQRHAERLPDTAPCPGCGRECPLERRERSIQTRDGAVALDEPVGRCHACERDFFPSASPARARRAGVQPGGARAHRGGRRLGQVV